MQSRNVGRYEILDQLGHGGMAVVYLARQRDLDRLVALKELTFRNDPDIVRRFLHESRVTSSLVHPNIVTVHEFLEHEDAAYIAMELFEQGSLRPWVGHMTPAQTVGVLTDTLSGLGHAAAAGIVHRDLKPENLLVTNEGSVKIADFGIAKAYSQLQYSMITTGEGLAVGTPGYMSPEQAMGREVDGASDLYAIGCIAYELATGQPVFSSDGAMAVLLQHVTESPPRACDVAPSVDPRLSAWIDRLLAKEPAERPGSADAAMDDLEEIAIALLGPRWRREAALGPRPSSPPEPLRTYTPATGFPRPLTPPPGPPIPQGFTPAPATAVTPFALPAAPPAPEPPPPAETVAPKRLLPPRPDSEAVVLPFPRLREPPPPVEEGSTGFTTPFVARAFERTLIAEFQYLHGPLVRDEGGIELLGNDRAVEQLKERLLHSRGGSFLVTGFRGVGKTTVVLRALDELTASRASPVEYLPVVLNVARPMTVDQLLFEVIRRLFETLTDRGVLNALEPDIREAMMLAYTRTSLAFKETSSRSRETSQTMSVDIGKLMPVGVAPKLGASRKRTDSRAREASFLAYSHADVEHDFLRIMSLLDLVGTAPPKPARRFRRRREPWRGRLVVVLDELDKLTASEEGMAAVDGLLMGLKNLLTARNVHFVFVGGPELHDAFMHDVARGNSVYESVFAYHLYVPCVWRASRPLVKKVVEPAAGADEEALDRLVEYFEFKARGIPRLLLRELAEFVRWNGDRARLSVSKADASRIAFYARIQQAVDDFVTNALDDRLRTLEIDEDRWRLGAYYVTDWILRRGRAEFTIAKILTDDDTPNRLMDASVDEDERLVRVEKLVHHLIAHGFVEKVWYEGVHQVLVEDLGQQDSFRLRDSIVDDLAGFAQRSESERAALGGVDGVGVSWATRSRWLKNGRYEIGDLIAIGGFSRVHRAVDRNTGNDVAIKFLAPQFAGEANARGRWRREVEIAKRLRHEHIVETYEVVEEGPTVAIVMELVLGRKLRGVLPLRTPAAVIIACQLLSALDEAAKSGLARFDMKPENIVFRRNRTAVIVDLGLVKSTNAASTAFATAIGPRIGTPAYMSPEQAMGREVDIRSDLYCVGIVLYETIVGRHPRDLTGSATDILWQITREPPDLSALDVSDGLRDALARALATDPDERFQTPAEMQAALLRTSEGEAGGRVPPDELLTPRTPTRGRFGFFRAPKLDDDPPAADATGANE